MNEVLDEQLNNHIEDKYYEKYFGARASYFIPKLHKYFKGDKFSFNISAFFFGPFWLVYRQLYVHAFVTFIIYGLKLFIEEIIFDIFWVHHENQLYISRFGILLIALIIGFTGNRFLLHKAINDVNSTLSQIQQEERRYLDLIEKGRGSLLAVAGTVALFLVIVIISVL
jgi:hypothetical protein